jgi:hypothetical protein
MKNHITCHAQVRLQQRGITAQVLDCLLAYGQTEHDHQGAKIVFFDHHARNRVRKALGNKEFKKLADRLDTYAVLAGDGAVVTVGHRTKRITRH